MNFEDMFKKQTNNAIQRQKNPIIVVSSLSSLSVAMLLFYLIDLKATSSHLFAGDSHSPTNVKQSFVRGKPGVGKTA